MERLVGKERLGWIPEGLGCSGKGFELPQQGAGGPVTVFGRRALVFGTVFGSSTFRTPLETLASSFAPDKRISCIGDRWGKYEELGHVSRHLSCLWAKLQPQAVG